MKALIEFFTKQSLFGILLTFFVVVIGLVALMLTRREVFPNVAYDVLTLTTPFPGASAEESEQLVTNPLEREIRELDGIKKLESHSVENRSLIIIQLDPDDTTEDEMKSDLRDIVDRVKPDLPENAEEPVIASMESKKEPIIEVGILSDELDAFKLRDLAKDIEEELEEIPGVARVETHGLRDLEIRVEASLSKLARYQLSLESLTAALEKQNLSIPGGTIEASNTLSSTNRALMSTEQQERLVRTSGKFKSVEDVKETVIRANDLGQSVRVRDVAEVSYALEKTTLLNHTNGAPSIRLQVVKKEKADAIKVVDLVKEKMESLKDRISKSASFEYLNDLSFVIRRRLKILGTNLLVGLVLVLCLLSLLLPWKVALIVSIGIPFSFFGTMILFNAWDRSINLISLIGLIIVSGMLVDDAIVITDNCVSRMEKGEDPIKASIKGAYQIWIPVTAAVMTTVVAFLPMMFMSGIFGKFVKEIPIGVVVALGFSLIEAFFILPGHLAKWVRFQAQTKKGKIAKLWEEKFVPGYLSLLRVAIRRRYWVGGAAVFLFTGSLFLAKGMDIILFPKDDIEIFTIRAQGDTGTSLAETEKRFQPVERILNQLPKEDLKNFITLIGMQGNRNQVALRGSEYAQATVFLTPPNSRKRSDAEIIEEVREKIGSPEGLSNIAFERVNPGPPVGKAVSLGIRAKSYEDILPVVNEIKDILSRTPGVSDIEDTYVLGKEEYQVNVNTSEAAAAGISVAEVGNTVRAAFEGIVATKLRKLDEEIDVRVSLSKEERTNGKTLENLKIPNAMGFRIPLSRVATISKSQGLAEYAHEANRRQIKVTGEVDTSKTTSKKVNAELKAMIPELKEKYPKVSIDFGGESKDTVESLVSLGKAFVVAMAGVLLLLVLAFRRLIQPLVLIVFVTIPMGLMSVVWAFFIHGKPLTFMGMLGMVALSGVIVNNAIVFIDFVNQRISEGMGLMDALLESAKARIRPIVLTTLTTAAGLLPTTYGIGGLDKFVVYITMALSWGLIFGSVLIAFVLPTSYAILEDVMGLFRPKRSAEITN